jgi:hypothetical protein
MVRGAASASRAPGDWYIEANETKSLGLVAEVL